MVPDYTIREAVRADIDLLVAFTLEEAHEAEGMEADARAVRRGVRGAFEDPPLAVYWVAETPDGRVVASTSVVTEWSNFHGGYYWWVQSLFIAPEHRGSGLVDRLLEYLARAAEASGALDLRLYVHNSNDRALRAYRRCGFRVAPYALGKEEFGLTVRGNRRAALGAQPNQDRVPARVAADLDWRARMGRPTKLQGQYLAFIAMYTKVHRRPPVRS